MANPACVRELHGATVTFGAGLEVINVAIPLSAAQINDTFVYCLWHANSRSAKVRYRTAEAASRAEQFLRQHNRILGHTFECQIQQPEVDSQGTTYPIALTKLDARTTTNDILHILEDNCMPERVNISQRNISEDDVQTLMSKRGVLRSWHSSWDAGTTKGKAMAEFSKQPEAARAVRELTEYVNKLHDCYMAFGHPITAKFHVFNKNMFDAIQEQLGTALQGASSFLRLWIDVNIKSESSQPYAEIIISGRFAKDVVKARKAVEKILSGCTAEDDDKLIWETYFLTPEGSSYLEQTWQIHGVYVFRDIRKARLVLYGPEDGVMFVQDLLAAKIRELSKAFHSIYLTPRLLQGAERGGWLIIKQRLGRQASNLDKRNKRITIQGLSRDVQLAESLLRNFTSLQLEGATCPICLSAPDRPLYLSCGHSYCRACFDYQWTHHQAAQLSSRCNICFTPFLLEDMMHLIPPRAFENLLQTEFVHYIRRNPKEFTYCPTPDCPQIYRPSNDGKIITCPQCAVQICTACKAVSHEGLTCNEHKIAVWEEEKDFANWKWSNGARDCPKCAMTLQKAFGCNHMVCGDCGIHICWICMATFERSGPCQSHMLEQHPNVAFG